MTTILRARRPARATLRTVALVGAVVLASGCGSAAEPADATAPASSPTRAAAAAAATATVTDAWVKAAPSGMTAMFGVLDNPTDRDITVVGGSSPSAGTVELHEVATVDGASVMRPKVDGFVVPAGSRHRLAPGADHVMLLDLTGPIAPGDRVQITLELADGGAIEVTALAKDFAAGNESYQPSMDSMGAPPTEGTPASPPAQGSS